MDKAELIKAFLADSDTSCPACGYGLRGVESECCPECGEHIELYLGSDPKLGPWVVSVSVVVIPLIVSVFWEIGAVISAWEDFDYMWWLIPPTIGIAVYAVALWWLVRERRKFWAKPRRDQVWSVIRYVLMTPLLVGAGFVIVFLLLLPRPPAP